MSRDFGKYSEDRAVDYLQELGFTIVDRNFYAKKYGEIDIVAKKDNVLHFVEVKSSRGSFEPILNITPSKIAKLIKSVHYYMDKKKLRYAYCIDALIIKDNQMDFIENITL